MHHENNIEFNIFSLKVSIFYLIVVLTSFVSGDVFAPIIVIIGIFLFLFDRKIRTDYWIYVKPLIVFLFVGFVGLIGHQMRHIFRDVVYALAPISLIYIGYWIADNKRWYLVFNHLMLAAVFLGFFHVSQFLFNTSLLQQSADDIRKVVYNPGGSLVVLAFVFGAFRNRLGLKNVISFFIPKYIVLSVLFLSFLLSFSRTDLLLFVVLIVSLLGFLDKINRKLLFILAILLSSFFIVVSTTPKDEVDTFRGKIAKSTKEVSVSNYVDMSDIYNNWRGFETYRAVFAFKNGDFLDKVFGFGFGSLVDLGFPISINDIEYRAIPILHNGYAYILFKVGILGIICYFFFFLRIILKSYKIINRASVEYRFLCKLLRGLTFGVMFSMVVVGGMVQIHDSVFVLLIGFVLKRLGALKTSI